MPARLDKQPICRTLDEELTISVKSLLIIAFITILFFIVAFLTKGPTYGIL